jgi:hypothetical protein
MSSSKAGHRVLIVKIIVFILLFSFIHNGLSELLSPIVYIPRTSMRGMYAQEKNIDIVFLGSSRAHYGFNPAVFDESLGLNTFNIATGAQSWSQSYYLLKELLKLHTPQTVIIGTAISRFNGTGATSARYGFIINDELRFLDNKLEYLLNAITKTEYLEALSPAYRYRDNLGIKMIENMYKKNRIKGYWDEAGLYRLDRFYKGYVINKSKLSNPKQGTLEINRSFKKNRNNTWDPGDIDLDAIEYFKKTVDLCKENNIDVILADTPNPPAVAIGAKNYDHYSNFIRDLANTNNVMLWDFNLLKMGYMEYDFDKFGDFVHMNDRGATEFSALFAKMLKLHYDGRFNSDQFFYDSYDEWHENYYDIANLWLINPKENNGIIKLAANCYCGKNVTPLYQFLIKKKGEKEYTKLQDYSENSVIEFKPEKGIEYVVRVNALSNKNMEAEPMYYVRSIKFE